MRNTAAWKTATNASIVYQLRGCVRRKRDWHRRRRWRRAGAVRGQCRGWRAFGVRLAVAGVVSAAVVTLAECGAVSPVVLGLAGAPAAAAVDGAPAEVVAVGGAGNRILVVIRAQRFL